MSLLERLTALFAPDECLSCRREGKLLCDRCTSALPSPLGACFGCHRTVSGVACAECLGHSGCNSMSAAVRYEGVAKQLVVSLKFVGNQSAAKVMAERMLATHSPTTNVLITHLPATAAHIRERGYDQAALIAIQLARRAERSHATLLSRLGKAHQLGADRQERLVQLKHALRIRKPELVRGRHILLIDDVLTTGASVRAATAALLDAGATKVDVLVFAQAVIAPK